MQVHQIPVSNENYLDVYLTLMNCFMKLTPMELKVLALFIRLGGRNNAGITTEIRQQAQTRLELKSPSNLNNYIKSMKDKGVLVVDKDTYTIHPRLHPTNEGVQFNFLWSSPK